MNVFHRHFLLANLIRTYSSYNYNLIFFISGSPCHGSLQITLMMKKMTHNYVTTEPPHFCSHGLRLDPSLEVTGLHCDVTTHILLLAHSSLYLWMPIVTRVSIVVKTLSGKDYQIGYQYYLRACLSHIAPDVP